MHFCSTLAFAERAGDETDSWHSVDRGHDDGAILAGLNVAADSHAAAAEVFDLDVTKAQSLKRTLNSIFEKIRCFVHVALIFRRALRFAHSRPMRKKTSVRRGGRKAVATNSLS